MPALAGRRSAPFRARPDSDVRLAPEGVGEWGRAREPVPRILSHQDRPIVNMTVAVTGASGFVGRYAVRELLARGCAVRALVRDRSHARAALGEEGGLPAGLTLVEGDVLDGSAPAELVRGAQ